jgi:hypothetical protein
MGEDPAGRRSRRHLLAAALGGIGALAAGVVTRPTRASAATGDNLVLGTDNSADATTRLTSTGSEIGVPALDLVPHEYGSGLHVATQNMPAIRTWLSSAHPEPAEPSRRATIWTGADTDSFALEVQGAVHFSRSGRAEIAAGQSSVTVEVPGYFRANSFALATLNTNRPEVWVRSVFLERTVLRKNRLTIYLNRATPSKVKCAWMVLN